MIIKTSKYNEISFEEAKKFIHCVAQVHKSASHNGVYLGTLEFSNGTSVRIYSDDEVSIADVVLPLAHSKGEYFNSSIRINGSLEDEIIALGYRYRVNDDGTFDVCYDHAQDPWFDTSWQSAVQIREDRKCWYFDCCAGAGEAGYLKSEWTFEDAFNEQFGDN